MKIPIEMLESRLHKVEKSILYYQEWLQETSVEVESVRSNLFGYVDEKYQIEQALQLITGEPYNAAEKREIKENN